MAVTDRPVQNPCNYGLFEDIETAVDDATEPILRELRDRRNAKKETLTVKRFYKTVTYEIRADDREHAIATWDWGGPEIPHDVPIKVFDASPTTEDPVTSATALDPNRRNDGGEPR